jgi:hypothetical protein
MGWPSLEPVRLMSLINAALVASFAIVAYVTSLTPEATALITTALAAWVAVAGEIARSKVVPLPKVALTKVEAAALERSGVS